MSKKLFSLALILLFSGNVAFAGGGWPQKKGKGYFKLNQFVLSSDRFYSPAGDLIDIVTAGLFTTSFYGEYGITDRLTAIAYVPFFSRATLNEEISGRTGEQLTPGDDVNSFGDTDLSLKYGLIVNKPIVVSATLTFGLPLGNEAGGNTQILQTGDGEFNQMLALEASHGFSNGDSWISTLVAINNRSKNFSDELRFGLEFGHKFGEKLSISAKVLSVNSLNNGSDLEVASNGIFSNNIEFLSFSPEVAYEFNDKFGVSASVSTVLDGKRVLATPSYSAGVFMNL
jgi:hypothetical protein